MTNLVVLFIRLWPEQNDNGGTRILLLLRVHNVYAAYNVRSTQRKLFSGYIILYANLNRRQHNILFICIETTVLSRENIYYILHTYVLS